jgi:hypothetical protein
MPDILERVNDFNRFKLEMRMSFNGEYYGCNTPSTESMQAKTTEDYYVSLALVNCKYLLVPAEQHLKNIPNYHFGYGYNLVLKISNGIGTYRFSDDEDKCHSKPYNYTGLEVRPYSPIARFTFCDDEQDSLTFHDLHLPESREETKGAKVFHVIDNIVHYSNQSDGSFPEHLIRATEELEELKQRLEEYRMRNNAGTLNEEQMKEMHELTIKREELVRILYEFEDSKKMLQIMFDARNRAATIIDETVDIDYHFEHDDQKGEVKFNIQVVHDPVKGK